MENLAQCRAAWWETQGVAGGLGLVNRRVEMHPGPVGLLARVALRPTIRSVVIASATYDPARQLVRLELADARRLALAAGRHIEEAEEWS